MCENPLVLLASGVEFVSIMQQLNSSLENSLRMNIHEYQAKALFSSTIKVRATQNSIKDKMTRRINILQCIVDKSEK